MKYMIVVTNNGDIGTRDQPGTARYRPELGVVADSPESPITGVWPLPGQENDNQDAALGWLVSRKMTPLQTIHAIGVNGLGYVADEEGWCIASPSKGNIPHEDQLMWQELNPDDGEEDGDEAGAIKEEQENAAAAASENGSASPAEQAPVGPTA